MSDFDEAFSKEFHQSATETHNDSIGVRNWNMNDIQPDQDSIMQTKKTNSRVSMVYKIIGGLAFCSITIIGIIKCGYPTINPSSSTSRQTLKSKWVEAATPITQGNCVKFIKTYQVEVAGTDESNKRFITLPIGTKATVQSVFGENTAEPNYEITVQRKRLSVIFPDRKSRDIDNMFLHPYHPNTDEIIQSMNPIPKWNQEQIRLPLKTKGANKKISAVDVKRCEEYSDWLAKNINDVLQETGVAIVKNNLETKGWVTKEGAAKDERGSVDVEIKAESKVTVLMEGGLNNDDNIIKFKNYHFSRGYDSDIFMKVNSDELSFIDTSNN